MGHHFNKWHEMWRVERMPDEHPAGVLVAFLDKV